MTEAGRIEELVVRAQRGDTGAFDTLVRRFQDMAVGYAYSLAGDMHAAEDVAQEAFLNAYLDLSKLSQPAAFPGWLKTIVYRRFQRVARTKKLSLVELDESTAAKAGIDSTNDWSARLEVSHIQQQIAALEPADKTILSLAYIGEYSQAEIGEFLNVPVSTVKNRLVSAKNKLRERLLTSVGDYLHQNAPSRDERFAERVREMIEATRSRDIDKVRSLLDDDPALANAAGEVPGWVGAAPTLLVAAENGDLEMARLLIDRGADVNAVSEWNADRGWGWKPLHMAADKPVIAALLIEHGATVDLFAASAMGDMRRVSELIAAEPDCVRALGPDGATALHFAKTVEVAKELVDHGANVDVLDQFHESSPVAWHFHGSNTAVVEFLLNHGANVDPFMMCAMGNEDGVMAQLEADPTLALARTPQHGMAGYNATMLHVAAEKGLVGAARKLLDMGADIDAKGNYESGTPLHYAAWNDQVAMIELLVANGATMEVDTAVYVNTPLGYAVLNSKLETVKLLIRLGANVTDLHLSDAERGAKGDFLSFTTAAKADYPPILDLLQAQRAKT